MEPIIKVQLACTINLGNFENVKIDVGFEDTIRKGETPDTAFDRIHKFAEDKLNEKIGEVRGQGNTKGNTKKNIKNTTRKIVRK